MEGLSSDSNVTSISLVCALNPVLCHQFGGEIEREMYGNADHFEALKIER
jgi:hypothetical protein